MNMERPNSTTPSEHAPSVSAPVIRMAPYRRKPDILARRIHRQIERLLKRDTLSENETKYLMKLYKQKQQLTRPLTFVG